MRPTISTFAQYQVFLNFPYDDAYEDFAEALAFAVVAGGLLPVTALDISTPDSLRLHNIVGAISNCRYSIHDLSRSAGGGGVDNLARMNMPIEMGMALYRALSTEHSEHQGAFVVPSRDLYRYFASDLAGLDPILYGDDRIRLLKGVYEWLADIVPAAYFAQQPISQVVQAYEEYSKLCQHVAPSGLKGRVSRRESCEIMRRVCGALGWWDWREWKAGRAAFPVLPLQWTEYPGEGIQHDVDRGI